MFTCGECGRNITAETKTKKSGKQYTHYKCTKFKTNCSQKPVTDNIINEEVEKCLEALYEDKFDKVID